MAKGFFDLAADAGRALGGPDRKAKSLLNPARAIPGHDLQFGAADFNSEKTIFHGKNVIRRAKA